MIKKLNIDRWDTDNFSSADEEMVAKINEIITVVNSMVVKNNLIGGINMNPKKTLSSIGKKFSV
jgi:hypothetical protein